MFRFVPLASEFVTIAVNLSLFSVAKRAVFFSSSIFSTTSIHTISLVSEHLGSSNEVKHSLTGPTLETGDFFSH